jgi:hypothetical protein
MTRSSTQRIAKRAAKFDPPVFRFPPPGALSEPIELEAYGLVLGLQHPDDCPLMVVAWNGQGFKRMLPEEASALADSLVADGQAVPLAPVIGALRKLVKRVGDIVSESIMRQMEVEGCA